MPRRNLIKNKRGSLQDLILIGVILLFFGMITLFSFKIANEFNEQIQDHADIPDRAKVASSGLVGNYTGVMDNMALFLLTGLIIAMLILAALVRVHPIFVPLFFIAWVILIFVAGILSNIYQETASQINDMEGGLREAEQLFFISNILTFLPLIIGVVGIVLMFVLYKIGPPAG